MAKKKKKQRTVKKKAPVLELDAAVTQVGAEVAEPEFPLTVLPASVMARTGGNGKRIPRAESLTLRLREILRMNAGELQETVEYCEKERIDPKAATVRDCLVHNLIAQALRGSSAHASELWNRIDGKPVQKTEVDVRAEMKMEQKVVLIDDLKLGIDLRKQLLKSMRAVKVVDDD